MRINHNCRSLAGRWKFATDPDGKGDFQEPDASIESWQRPVTYFDLEYDDTAWDKIAVPACWQTEGHRYNGIAWYRTRFDYAPDGANNVIRLHCQGRRLLRRRVAERLLPRLPRRLLPPLLVRRLALDQAGREPARRQGGCPEPEAGADEGGAAGHQLGLQRPDPRPRRHLERRTTARQPRSVRRRPEGHAVHRPGAQLGARSVPRHPLQHHA